MRTCPTITTGYATTACWRFQLDGPDLTGQSRRRERDRGHALACSKHAPTGWSWVRRWNARRSDRYKVKVVASTEQIDDLLVESVPGTCPSTLPERIVLDVDATDDQLHGQQEGRFYHGYYRHYCYLPLYITCGEHRRSVCAPADGAGGGSGGDGRGIGADRAATIRQRWPQAAIVVHRGRRFFPGHAHELVRAVGEWTMCWAWRGTVV